MLEAASRYDWEHTSFLACLIANASRAENSPARTPDDFNPWALVDREVAVQADDGSDIDGLTNLWVGGGAEEG